MLKLSTIQMQQRGPNPTSTTMESDDNNQFNSTASRGRLNTKSKLLVRSHAMRESASPPREPSPANHSHQIQSPSIQLTPSPEVSPENGSSPHFNQPMVVLSPSEHSPCRTPPCLSPTPTLVATPSPRRSPLCASSDDDRLQAADTELPPLAQPLSPKYLTCSSNQQVMDKASHVSHVRKKPNCDCEQQEQQQQQIQQQMQQQQQQQQYQNNSCLKCMNKERNLNNNVNSSMNNNNVLCVTQPMMRGNKLRHQSSSGSFEGSSMNSSCLSRESSSELYTDTTGVDLELFISKTLNRNSKDRSFVLNVEGILVKLAKDKNQTEFKFAPMTSYQRMLIHRVAAFFGMDHNLEPATKCIIVNKTINTRIPDIEFSSYIKENAVFTDQGHREPRRSILKRDSNSVDEDCFNKSPDRGYDMENKRSKSFEQREADYKMARKRIFNRDDMHEGSSEDFSWNEIPWSSTESEYSSKFRLQPPEFHGRHLRRLLKVHSEETGDTLRPCVAKSYSFGGYGGSGVSVLGRGDSVMSTHSAGPRLLTKQDSGASSVSWRLSPSSSGYKSQSQMSESVTPSPTSTPHPMCLGNSRQDSGCGIIENSGPPPLADDSSGGGQVVWAVTDIQNVPKGSVIINPQNGKPIKNSDGTIYHFDPDNPLPGFHVTQKLPPSSSLSSTEQHVISSPKKHKTPVKHVSSSCTTPSKGNLINSATSPSLPFSPPPPPPPQVAPQSCMPCSRSYSCLQVASSCENVSNLQQSSIIGAIDSTTYIPNSVDNSLPIYQQPYIVYTAPFGVAVPQHFENRIEQTQVQIPNTYYVPDNAPTTPAASTLSYQPSAPTGPYWNQQPVTFYSPTPTSQSAPALSSRFAGHIQHHGQSGFMPATYPTTFVTTQPVPPPPQTPELVPVYSNQPVQMIYHQNQPPPHVVYTHNPAVYPSFGQPGVPPHPQSTPTPNSCTASTPTAGYAGGPPPPHDPIHGYMQLTQNMQQLNISPGPNPGFVKTKCQQFDMRYRNNTTSKYNKFPKHMMGSSQSSTGTNSPAATVIATGYCPQNPPGMYGTPPGTPPMNQFATFPPNFGVAAPMLYRQMSNNVRSSTPGTAKSSRSPTPASDISHFDRQRMTMPPMYQTMPLIIQPDARFIGRGQPNSYRPMAPFNRQQSFNQGPDYRSQNRGRRPKGKPNGIFPPTGKAD